MKQIQKSLRTGCLIAIVVSVALSTYVHATDYQIEVALDTDTKIISGHQTITWTNNTEYPAEELQFHLYFNAWRNEQSSFLTSNRIATGDFSEWKKEEWAYNDVKYLEVVFDLPSTDPQVVSTKVFDVTQKMEFIQPDDGNPEDRTVMRVYLPEPVTPSQTIQIRLAFATKVPRPFARTGVRGDYYFLAHWFPKLGVFEENGKWNCHQFIQTEFYSDYGTYDVKLRLPAKWVVGATGQLQEKVDQGDGTTLHYFHQDDVHGFAWTASPQFQEHRRRFEHPSLPFVDMRLLLMPDHSGQEERYFAATEAALRLYGEWFGAYPYGHVTIIDPAYKSRSGGMEYATIFTGGTRWLNPEGSGSPEGVTVHECGHQFWYGIIGNNEFEDAWIDEGFDTYSTRRVMLEEFHPSYTVRRYMDGFLPLLFEGLPRAPRSVAGLGGYHSPLKLDRMSRPSWQYGPAAARHLENENTSRVYSSGAYGVNSYTKPAMMLLTLERYFGWETFQKIMSSFFERYRLKRPRPQDYFEIVDEISGQDLSWFWEETFYSSNVFDYAVDAVGSPDGKNTVTVRRWGEAVFPVEVRVSFEDKTEQVRFWDGRDRWKQYTFDSGKEIVAVEVDPDQVLALDVNRRNNSWTRDAPDTFASCKWALKWMIWLQNLMELSVSLI
jgi:hypothetical protein